MLTSNSNDHPTVLKYYEVEEVAFMASERGKMANHLVHSGPSREALAESQKLFELPPTKVTRSMKVRWRSQHNQSRWYRQAQPALEDVKYVVDVVDKGDSFNDHLLTRDQFVLNNEEEGSLSVLARTELALEPTNSPTLSLVLPTVDACMVSLESDTKVKMGDGSIISAKDMAAASRQARQNVLGALELSFDQEIDPEYLSTLQVATFCDPRHKNFDLKHKSPGALRKFKKEAIQKAKNLYDSEYKRPELSPPSSASDAEESSENKRRKLDDTLRRDYAVDMCDLLGRADEPLQEVEDKSAEWERYLALPQISASEDLLKWWKKNETKFPQVSKMAYQVLGCPACSSGVERLFSKAGRNYTADRKNTNAATMADILFSLNLKIKKKKKGKKA